VRKRKDVRAQGSGQVFEGDELEYSIFPKKIWVQEFTGWVTGYQEWSLVGIIDKLATNLLLGMPQLTDKK